MVDDAGRRRTKIEVIDRSGDDVMIPPVGTATKRRDVARQRQHWAAVPCADAVIEQRRGCNVDVHHVPFDRRRCDRFHYRY